MAEPLWRFCAGMRFDGTNATIIDGEGKDVRFVADRNNIARVWMDHAAWPLRTIALYLDETGDLDFLMRRQTYFYDGRVMRCRETIPDRDTASGTELPIKNGGFWRGTILEHLLLETLTACCDVGEHGMLRLENADWDDALDMAAERGESVAFSSMYAGNLKTLAGFLRALAARGTETVELAAELIELTNGLQDEAPPDRMQERLNHFCTSCCESISGNIAVVNTEDLAGLLERHASRLAKRIRQQEQVTDGTYRWLNGYYDNDGLPVERGKPEVRMTLTGQVFALRYGVADKIFAKDIAAAADHYLFAPELGGYRLNTDFHELKLNLGRQFGFAYGHKENGSVFSHMAVMYANALYHCGMVKEGRRALAALIGHSMDFRKSRIYPGIPEYFGPDGRGMYHYLTGAASWLTLTLRCEVFGISGRLGNLFLSPKLTAEDFADRRLLSCETYFLGRRMRVSYRNPLHLDYGGYTIGNVLLDGNLAARAVRKDGCFVLPSDVIRSLDTKHLHTLDAELTFNGQK
jgi:cellobiose phosphorylase